MDRMIKKIKATRHLDVLVWEDKEGTSGYLSIKHNARINDTDNEVIVDTPDVPDLVKALTQAALELYLRGSMLVGYKQGFDDGEEEKTKSICAGLEDYFITGGTIESLLATANRSSKN